MNEYAIHMSGDAVYAQATFLGTEFRTQREALGLSVEDVFERTRINPAFINAIEAGMFDNLPEAYSRLFVKNYALSIGLDAQEILARFDKIQNGPDHEEIVPEEPEEPPTRSKKRRLIYAAIVVALAAAGGVAGWYWLYPEKEPVLLEVQAEQALPPQEPARKTSLVDGYAMSTQLPLAGGETSMWLTGQAQENTWVWVWSDGELIFNGQVEPEQEMRWETDRLFRIEIEKPSALTLDLAGQPLALNAAPDHRLRLYISRFSIWVEERASQ